MAVKRFLFCLLAVLALCLAAAAYTVPDNTTVYITPTGEKYHREDCTYTTKATVRAMTIANAEARGYGACSRCDPDVLVGAYSSKWDGVSGGGGSNGGKVTIGAAADSNNAEMENKVKDLQKQVDELSAAVSEYESQKQKLADWVTLTLILLFFTPLGWLLLDWLFFAPRQKIKSLQQANAALLEVNRELSAEKNRSGVTQAGSGEMPRVVPAPRSAEDIAEEERQAQAFRVEQTELYAGKSMAQMAGVPDDVEMDIHGWPHTKGRQGSRMDAFMVFSNNGKVYHTAACRYAGGERLHVFMAVNKGMRPCSVCDPPSGTPQAWFYEWHRLNRIREQYGFGMLP